MKRQGRHEPVEIHRSFEYDPRQARSLGEVSMSLDMVTPSVLALAGFIATVILWWMGGRP